MASTLPPDPLDASAPTPNGTTGHGPTPSHLSLRPTPLGLGLFLVYVSLYGSFVAWVVSGPATAGSGVPSPVYWGLGLILAAFILAIIYAAGPSAAADETHGEANR